MTNRSWVATEKHATIQKSVFRVLLAWHKKGNVRGNIAEQVEGSKWQVEGSGREERRAGERGGNGWWRGGERHRNYRVTRTVNTPTGVQHGQQ